MRTNRRMAQSMRITMTVNMNTVTSTPKWF